MILQSLHDYYLRLQDDPESGIAALGFSPQQISFAIILDQEGNLIQIQDIRDSSAKKPHAIELMAPEGQVRTAGISANFLWDNSGYVLGIDSKGKPERSRATFKSFREKQLEIGGEIKDNGMLAVLKFLKAWKPSQGRKLPNYNEILGSNLVFRLKNEKSYIHDHPKIKKA